MKSRLESVAQVAVLATAGLVGGCGKFSPEVGSLPKIPAASAFDAGCVEGARIGRYRYHEVMPSPLHGGMLLGRLGAGWSVVDPNTGAPLSVSYHSFEEVGGALIGVNGAMKFLLHPTSFVPLTLGHHSLTPLHGLLVGSVAGRSELIHPTSGSSVDGSYQSFVFDGTSFFGEKADGTRTKIEVPPR